VLEISRLIVCCSVIARPSSVAVDDEGDSVAAVTILVITESVACDEICVLDTVVHLTQLFVTAASETSNHTVSCMTHMTKIEHSFN
jgi:hypothetical protein